MRFAVIGAGNMGCVYGGNLARIGHAVCLIDVWKEHVDQIRAGGLRLEGLSGDFNVRVQATTDPAEADQCDVALICVNAYSTAQAAQTARAVLGDEGCCLTLQNGVGNVEILSDALGAQRVLAGLSFQSGDLEEPGKVRHTNNGPTYLGELDRSRSKRLQQLEQVLAEASLNPVVVEDVMATIWGKFVHNCGINAICAITGLRPGHIQEVAALDEFQIGIIEEAAALVRRKGITLPDADPVAAIREYCAHKFHRPSMMQHLDRGQQTEIDALNGFVARESARLGLSAPCNTALTALIKGRQHQPVRSAAQ